MNKLRSSSLPLTELLEPRELDKIISDLFPRDEEDPNTLFNVNEWNEDWDVSPAEVYRGIKKKTSNNTAPGPDGLSSKLWKLVPDRAFELVSRILTSCLRKGVFPTTWKSARLVLIPKNQPEGNAPIKARPICLLNEIGKIFERIILDRIFDWISNKEGILSANQFDFRKGRSTTDALAKVTRLIEDEITTGGVVVSIDIKNTFNSLSWRGRCTWTQYNWTRCKWTRYN